MQVKGLNQSIIGLPSWSQFLMRSALMCATLLLGSALIMAVAANWFSWPKVGRIALLELTVAILVLCVGWLIRVREEPKGWATVYNLSSLVQLLAAISLGGLLALIGQSYQTGADPWQLFAVWALLLLPWAVGLRSLFIILLVLLLTNLTLYLYVDEVYGVHRLVWREINAVGGFFVLLNAFWLGLSLFCSTREADPHHTWFRLSVLLLVGSVVAWSLMQNQHHFAFVSAALALVFLASRWGRSRRDIWSLTVFYSAIFALGWFWLAEVLEAGIWQVELLFAVTLVLGTVLLRDLRFIWLQRVVSAASDSDLNTQVKSTEPWIVRGFSFGLQLVLALLFTWLLMRFFEALTLAFAYVYIAGAFWLMLRLMKQKNSEGWRQDTPLFLYLSSCFCMGVLLLDSTQATLFLLIGFLALAVFVYVCSASHYLVRLSSALVGWGFVLYGLVWHMDTYAWDAMSVAAWCFGLAWLGLSFWLQLQASVRSSLLALWWATLFWFLVSVFVAEVGTLHQVIAWAVPAVMLLSVYRSQSVWFCLGAVAISTGLSVYWLQGALLANVALVIWMLSYSWKQPRLFWLAVLLFAAALSHYYYSLSLPLITKAWDLARGGGVLALAALFLFTRQPRQQSEGSPAMTTAMTSKRELSLEYVALYGGLVLVLATTIWDVARKEQLLAQGQALVLQLAPVDPRSLMQGDYMALRFTLNQSVRQLRLLETRGVQGRELIAYMHPSPNSVARLVALENPATGQYWKRVETTEGWIVAIKPNQDDSTVYPLRLRYKQGSWLPNGINAWFFPEGRAAHYEKAHYGVFKVNHKADALLYQLLDEHKQPL